MTTKRLSYKDDFEMLVIRHDYLRKVDYVDPQWISRFEPIVKTTARKIFNKHEVTFGRINYDLEDIESIANCYMISYMSLYSIERNREKRDKINQTYINRFGRDMTPYEATRKETVNLIAFLRQKLNHAALVTRRKSTNVIVDKDIQVAYAMTEDSIPVSNDHIIRDGKSFGYRKVTGKELKEAKAEAKLKKEKVLYDKDGYMIVELYKSADSSSLEIYDNYFVEDSTNRYHRSPESILSSDSDESMLEDIADKFFSLPIESKKRFLKDFIDKNKGKTRLRSELASARKMMKKFEFLINSNNKEEFMENKDLFIKTWYENTSNTSIESIYLNTIALLRSMRDNGLAKSDMEEVGPMILENIKGDTSFDYVNDIYNIHIGHTIKKAFDVAFQNMEKVVTEDVNDGIDDSGIKAGNTPIFSTTEEVEYVEPPSQDTELEQYLDSLKFTPQE